MIDINKDFIEITNPHDAALVQIILDTASYKYRVESATIHLNYTYYPDDMSQEEITESRRLKKEYARQQEEELNAMSRNELKQLMKDKSVVLIDEDPEMDCWAIRFFLEQEDKRFLDTLINQIENLNERIEDRVNPDPELLACYAELLDKYNRQSDHVDHPYEDLSAPYPFVYASPKNPNLEPFQPRSREQLETSVASAFPIFNVKR